MPYKSIVKMTQAMEQLKARDHLLRMEASRYAQLKHDAQKKIYRKWRKLGFPQEYEQSAVKNEDLILSI